MTLIWSGPPRLNRLTRSLDFSIAKSIASTHSSTKRGAGLLGDKKPIYVLDATALIYFARIGKLKLIPDICEAYITAEVYSEVVEKGERYPDSLLVRDAVGSGKIKIHNIKNERLVYSLLRHPEIHRGEGETLAAAKELNGVAVIDEKEARVIARAYGVDTVPGTLFLLFRLLKLKKISVNEAEEMLGELLASGLYLDPRTLLRAKEMMERYKRGMPHTAD